jgi:hypothetical protein
MQDVKGGGDDEMVAFFGVEDQRAKGGGDDEMVAFFGVEDQRAIADHKRFKLALKDLSDVTRKAKIRAEC